MLRAITNVRRKLTVDAVVRDGERLRALYYQRAAAHPSESMDDVIETLERRQRQRLQFLKDTA